MYVIKVVFTLLVTVSIVSSSPQFKTQRIINGVESTEPHKWIARIVTKFQSTNEGLDVETDCGGSLIDDQWILTAKHCLLDKNANEVSDGYDISIGNNNYLKGQVINVTKHFFYSNETQIDHDIALLKLQNAPDNITAIPVQYDNDLDYEGKTVTLYGWGLTDPRNDNSDVTQLRQTNVVLNTNNTNVPEDVLRFDPHTTNSNSCKGDSGGPMTIDKNGLETLIGVSHVSQIINGIPCQGDFSEYTKTFYPDYSKWIQDTIKNNSD